jgi:hypothetical protein
VHDTGPKGGILGGLAGWSVSKEHIQEAVRGGDCLVIAHGSEEDVANANSFLTGTRPAQLIMHSSENGNDKEMKRQSAPSSRCGSVTLTSGRPERSVTASKPATSAMRKCEKRRPTCTPC